MQSESTYSAAFDFSNYDSSSEDEATSKPTKHTRKRSRRCLEPTSSSLAAPTFHELHSVETSNKFTNLEFTIYGHPCVLHEDSHGFANELESEQNFINVLDTDSSFDHDIIHGTCLSNEKNQRNVNDSNSMYLYVDKYDVRTLMTREDLLLLNGDDTYRNNEEWDDDLTLEERKELEELRFGDMYISCSRVRSQENQDLKGEVEEMDSKKTHLSDENFEIKSEEMNTNNERSTTTATASAKIDDENSRDVVFELEASIRSSIPANITIPSTKRQFDIIQMTAKKSCHQPQFELFLKVKEQTNPEFQFLSKENDLYPFYLAMKESFESKIETEQNEPKQKAIGLLDMYSSSSDEENEQESSHSEEKVINEQVSAITQSNTDCRNELTKEEKRAMRLKKAKSLRHRFQQS